MIRSDPNGNRLIVVPYEERNNPEHKAEKYKKAKYSVMFWAAVGY